MEQIYTVSKHFRHFENFSNLSLPPPPPPPREKDFVNFTRKNVFDKSGQVKKILANVFLPRNFIFSLLYAYGE
jgi:hypothetical protein